MSIHQKQFSEPGSYSISFEIFLEQWIGSF